MNIGEEFYCSRCMRPVEDEEDICPHCGYDPYHDSDTHLLEEGTLLNNGRYQIGAVIGSGGFGITYAAWDRKFDQPVAIKEYYSRNLCERNTTEDDTVTVNPDSEYIYQKGLDRFIREAKILNTLENVKNVVPVIEWFEANNTAYIVMKYIRGITLEEYVQKNNIQPQKLIAMMREIIDSLILIHQQGILHRDISPTNIMVQEDGTMILIDFGAAALEDQISQGKGKTAIFNRRYAPPEQYDESGMQGPWTDVYALSATIYHMICNEPPLESIARTGKDTLKSPDELGIHLKKYQNKAIMQGLTLKPDKRIQSMDIFRSVLYNLPMPEEVIRRRRFMIRVISAAALFILVSILVMINYSFGFYLGNGIRYSLYGDGLHIRGSSSESENITLPSKIAGVNIVQIDEGAFQGSEKLRDVYIPGTIETIERFAFNGCNNLTNVTLDEGVKRISSQSFTNCNNLQAVMIPDSVNEISADAFSNSSERLVLIGNMNNKAHELAGKLNLNYSHIETKDNESGVTLTKYESSQGNANIPDSINGKPVTVIDSGQNISVFVLPRETAHNIILPARLERIGNYAFYQVQIRAINFPETLTHIGEYAFSETYIENLSLPDSVISLGKSAFSPCVSLRTVKLSSGMKEIPEGCFENVYSMTSLTIPKGITEIKFMAFRGCSSLTSVGLPEGIKIIGDYAFGDCTALESIYLPPSLARMNVAALEGCRNSLAIIGWGGTFAQYFTERYGFEFHDMKKADRNIGISPRGNIIIDKQTEESDNIILPSYRMNITVKRISLAISLRSRNIIMPSHIEEISTASFYGNKYLESFSCPDTLKQIGTLAFGNCENLKDAKLGNGITDIGSAAFASCSGLESITLPSSLKTIEAGAFEHCTGLKSIDIPASIIMLHDDVFADTGLTSVTVPGNVSKLGTAFYGCKNLRTAILEEGVRTIRGTFAECDSLETVIIPSTVQRISRSSFMGCKNLKDVWIYSDNIELDYFTGATRHIEYTCATKHIEYANMSFEYPDMNFQITNLEKDNKTKLFTDIPGVTIHARRGSNAHLYAEINNIKFALISDDANNEPKTQKFRYKSSERIYSDEEIIAIIDPKDDNDPGRIWTRFRYAYGYGFSELAFKCLDAYMKFGGEYEKIWGTSAKLFLEQSESHGYTSGEAIADFEGHKGHPVLKAGDIIVEVEGKTFRDYDEFNRLMKEGKPESRKLTVLRANDKGILEKHEVINVKGQPLFAVMSVSPLTFEEL